MLSQAVRKAAILVVATLMLWGPLAVRAQTPVTVIVYSQPPSIYGGILWSSLREPDGSDTDWWVWDSFRFAQTQTITEIRWVGAYDPDRRGSGGPVFDFQIEIYASAAIDTQPDIANTPLGKYELVGTAGETPGEVLYRVQTYNYGYILPEPFQATAGTKYWVQIEAFQAGPPDWGLAASTAGDGSHFRRIPGAGPGYQFAPGDAAFYLLGPRSGGVTLYLPMAVRGIGG